METTSVAGQIAAALEDGLDKAGRRGGLSSLPSAGSKCFFEDPLGPWLQDLAPRCPPEDGRPMEFQPRWQCLASGSFTPAGQAEPMHLYELVGNGFGSREARHRMQELLSQWVFLTWLNWYQQPHLRFPHLQRVVLVKTVRQISPATRIWSGYLCLMQALTTRFGGEAMCALPPVLALPDEESFRHRFSHEPAWVDALGRMAIRDRHAREYASSADLLGVSPTALWKADWRWTAGAAVAPSLLTISNKRCSRSAFAKLAQALRLDRWLAEHCGLDLAGSPPPDAPPEDKERSMETQRAIEARNSALRDMSAAMDSPGAQGGSLRLSDTANRRPDGGGAPKVVFPWSAAGLAARPEARPSWNPAPRLLVKHLDPDEPSHLAVEVDHAEFCQEVADPSMGFLMHIEVKDGPTVHRRLAYAHSYLPPLQGSATKTGCLLLEMDDPESLPWLGAHGAGAPTSRPGRWRFACRVVESTGEPVMLLRIDM